MFLPLWRMARALPPLSKEVAAVARKLAAPRQPLRMALCKLRFAEITQK
jgi:hypothetical protein